MKPALLLLPVLASAASAAAAQPPALAPIRVDRDYHMIAQGRPPNRTQMGVTCLREISTRRSVCRSRAEWQRIAQRIERGLPWQD